MTKHDAEIKYSIIMPFYNRTEQFRQTIKSFERHYKKRRDYEIIIIESYYNCRPGNLTDHENLHSFLSERLKEGLGRWPIIRCAYLPDITHNPCIAYNFGVNLAEGRYIILTNPECLHETPILEQLDQEDLEENYIVCGCKSHDGRWYQHSVHRAECFHFCTCISKETYRLVGGFDESYARGIGYDDNDFILTLRHNNIPILQRDDYLTIHQQHSRAYQANQLVGVNKRYINEKWKKIIR